jgi:hypothetical protein
MDDNKRQCTTEDGKLWGTKDVMAYMGRSRDYISKLCSTGQIPLIPGKPYRFVPGAVKQAVFEMQQGGQFGKKRRRAA